MAETLRREEGFVVGSDSAVTLTGDHTHFHCTRRQLHFTSLCFLFGFSLNFTSSLLCFVRTEEKHINHPFYLITFFKNIKKIINLNGFIFTKGPTIFF